MRQTIISLIDYDPSHPLHAESFGALNREWLTKYYYVEPQDEEMFADPKAYILDKGGVIIFAVNAHSDIVGTGCLLPLGDGAYEIARMAVTHSSQGQGIGGRILRELLSRARARKIPKLFIVSNTERASAIHLYRKHGFTDSAENRHCHYERGNITLELALQE